MHKMGLALRLLSLSKDIIRTHKLIEFHTRGKQGWYVFYPGNGAFC